MKTNCILQAGLHSIIIGSPTNNSKNTTTDVPCSLACGSCCCAILVLRYVAERCDDPAAFAEDIRKLLKKYPLN